MMGGLIIAAAIGSSMAVWRIGRRLRFFLHILQLEGYKTTRYRHWVKDRAGDLLLRRSHVVGTLLLVAGWAVMAVTDISQAHMTTVLALLWALAFASSSRYRRDQPKKPFAATARMKRLIAVTIAVTAVPVVVGAAGWLAALGPAPSLAYFGGLLVADLAAPIIVWGAGHLMKPVEHRVHEGFKDLARSRLADRPDLTTIAITGSYGKTSTKFAVRDILAQRFQVLATPGSFNTPMGICRIINNRLRDDHRFLVLEMGIRHPGDIAELCDIAAPDIAIITSVGIAHLESMGTVRAIADEKGSLLEFLRPDGVAILNADDERVRQMAERAPGEVWLVATDEETPAHLRAGDISFGPDGTSFSVSGERSGTSEPLLMETRLLGRHNVTNILLALAAGRAAGLRLRQMKHAVARMMPVPHRLELRNEGGLTIVDDAFNSNPIGARNALDILSEFDTGRRVVITPGMIELGSREKDENRAFGRHMASAADWVVLVGPQRTIPIRQGLIEEGFPDERIRTVSSLFEARVWMRRTCVPGDVVLFENDLPDQFNEV